MRHIKPRTFARIALPGPSRVFSTNTSTSTTPSPVQIHQSIELPSKRTLSFAEYGSPQGHPLLFLHGFPSSRLEASALHTTALQKNIRLISPDRPGYGLSTYQSNRSIPNWVDDIRSLVDYLELSKYAVLGGSGGGPYALACARFLDAERMSGVGLLASGGPWEAGMEHVSYSRRLFAFLARRTPGLLGYGIDGTVNVLRWAISTQAVTNRINMWLESQESSEKSELDIDKRREMLLGMVFEAFRQGSAATVQEAVLLSEDWGFRLEDVRYQPVRIWHGEEDRNAPVAMIRYMAERVPGAVLRVYEGETHYTVARYLEEMLDELIPAAALRRKEELGSA
ncbi:Alpha/Beta hydrolase protein [Aspergillus karnatakaensis]|uniref:alpha/beta fold hydrolase n=1 Tax=Aspergillus karnatakaensis TaxID=1810916 RepID=UPI003CCD31D6